MKTTYGESKVGVHKTTTFPATKEIRKSAASFIDTINKIPFPPDENEAEQAEWLSLKQRAMDKVEEACSLAEKALEI